MPLMIPLMMIVAGIILWWIGCVGQEAMAKVQKSEKYEKEHPFGLDTNLPKDELEKAVNQIKEHLMWYRNELQILINKYGRHRVNTCVDPNGGSYHWSKFNIDKNCAKEVRKLKNKFYETIHPKMIKDEDDNMKYSDYNWFDNKPIIKQLYANIGITF